MVPYMWIDPTHWPLATPGALLKPQGRIPPHDLDIKLHAMAHRVNKCKKSYQIGLLFCCDNS